MPEEDAPEDATGVAADPIPDEIGEEHDEAGTSPASDAAGPEPPMIGPRSAGPPADWLEKVRRHAPGLLASPTQRAASPAVVPRRRVVPGAEVVQATVPAIERPTPGAGTPPPQTQAAAAQPPPDESARGWPPEVAASDPGPLESRVDNDPARPPVPPWPGQAEDASGRRSAERVADQAEEAWSSADRGAEPGPVQQADPQSGAVDEFRMADPLTAAYRPFLPAKSFSPIVAVAASHQGHQPALEVVPERARRGEPWPSPAPPLSPMAAPDPWLAISPADAPARPVGLAEPATFANSVPLKAPVPSEATPPIDPAARWPTLPPAGPTEDAFEVATALRSRDRWSRLVREQESA